MLTKNPFLEIDVQDPFKDDALEREHSCNSIADFIQDADKPYVLAVNAKWGEGKTTFLKMLRAVCEKREFSSVFFNAWKADFHGDALAAMIGEIEEELENKLKDQSKWLMHKIKKAGRKLVSHQGATTAVKILSRSIGAGALVDDISETLKGFDAVDEYTTYRSGLQEFKKLLEQYVKQSKIPLVFFVDELDRCRPIFAVEVLEKVKHIFDIEGVFFVIAINKEELEKTVKSVYGDIQSDIYLRRFFDREYSLINKSGFIDSVMRNIEYYDHFETRDHLARKERYETARLDLSYHAEFFEMLCDAYGFSLRDREQVIHMIASSLMMTEPTRTPNPSITGFFSVMYLAHPNKFKEFLLKAESELDFPFDDLAKYYEDSVNTKFDDPNFQFTGEGKMLAYPYIWCCAHRARIDDEYRRNVLQLQEDDRTRSIYQGIWHRILEVSNRNLLLLSPVEMIRPIAQIRKYAFKNFSLDPEPQPGFSRPES